MSVNISSTNNIVTVTQPNGTLVVQVATPGPRGIRGEKGDQGDQGLPAQIEDWILGQEKEILPTEVVTVSGDFVIEDSILQLSDSGSSYTYGTLTFKKYAKMFIGGNLLIKDSQVINNGLISVAGGVVLIGDSQITGTGTII